MKILLVDEDREFREEVFKFFEGSSNEVICANDCNLALLTLKENSEERFDLVVVNWNMPHNVAENLVKTIRRLYIGQRLWIIYVANVENPEKVGSSIANNLLRQNVSRYNIIQRKELLDQLRTELEIAARRIRVG